MDTTTGRRLRIAEVAERTGFSTPTLRYYEDIGLMPAAERTEAGYRSYDDTALERLRFISRAKQLGCTLDEIKDLTTTWATHECAPVQHRLRGLVGTKLTEAEEQITELQALAAELRATAEILAAQPVDGPCDDTCGCISDPSPRSAPVTLGAKPAEVPIACSLGAGELRGQLAEWASLLGAASDRQPIPGGLRVTFADGAPLQELARLVAAEQRCCPFFAFAITVDRRGTALEVTAPEDAQDLVTAAFGAAS